MATNVFPYGIYWLLSK